MSEVKRFSLKLTQCGNYMDRADDGAYVLAADYDTIEAARVKAKEECGQLRTAIGNAAAKEAEQYDQDCAEYNRVCGERDALAAELAEIKNSMTYRTSLIGRLSAENEALKAGAGEPFAWATFDGEGGHDLRLYEESETYRDEWVAVNGAKYADWVFALYTKPPIAPDVSGLVSALTDAAEFYKSEMTICEDDGNEHVASQWRERLDAAREALAKFEKGGD